MLLCPSRQLVAHYP